MKSKEPIDIYKEQGYEDRTDYLKCLADEYGIDEGRVFAIAETLGPEEDFDMLLTSFIRTRLYLIT